VLGVKIRDIHVNLLTNLVKFNFFGTKDLENTGFPSYVIADLLKHNLIRKVPVNGYETIQLTDLGTVFMTRLTTGSSNLIPKSGESDSDFISRVASDVFNRLVS
jgi:hypothetical protein